MAAKTSARPSGEMAIGDRVGCRWRVDLEADLVGLGLWPAQICDHAGRDAARHEGRHPQQPLRDPLPDRAGSAAAIGPPGR